jgi:hypothetical protein
MLGSRDTIRTSGLPRDHRDSDNLDQSPQVNDE